MPSGKIDEELRKSEAAIKALRLRESYLSAIIENQPGLLWMKDRDGRFLAVNTQFSNSCGMDGPESLVGKTDMDIWPHELAAKYIADDNRVMRSGKPCIVEEPISDKGVVRWFETFKAPIMDERRMIIGTTGYSRDITERKQAEAALQASESKYRDLANSIPIGIFECDLQGKLSFANKILFDWFGYTEEEYLAGINIFDLIDPKEHARAKKNLAQVFSPQPSQPHEYRVIRKNGSEMHVLIIARPLRAYEQDVGFRGILLDLTEKMKMESMINNTTRLESLGVLAGGIAHDFNNLLTGIFGYIDLARSVSTDANVQEYLEATLASMTRARALTLQLLTFAKGGSPVQKLTPLIPFIQEVAQFALSGSNISCKFFLMKNLWPCNIDKNQIGQVIDNIIINAQQAMPSGGAIEIAAENIALGEKEHPPLAKGNYVKASIKDFGIGIPKDILLRIFDPFYTTKTKGHGLGLATCYSIVNRHGGCIDVESEPGKGSTFHIYLPASLETVAAPAAMVIKHRGSGTIIVMEDEEIIQYAFRKMLESLGYAVVCKKDGKEALDFYTSETMAGSAFAAMIFDLTVPGGMGGKEAVAEVRKLDKVIPVFVASGYADDPVMKNPLTYGFTASISKPFTIAELSEMLNKNMNGGKK